MVKVLFLGGDLRQTEIINELYCQGHKIDVVGYKNILLPQYVYDKKIDNVVISDYNVIIFPVDGVKKDNVITAKFTDDIIALPDDLLVNTKKNVLIFTGIMTPDLNKMLEISNREATILMNDNEIKKQNSIPTVEGIIGNIIFNTKYTINGSNVLVFGYGNVGKSLVEMLGYFKANITVGVKEKQDYDSLKKNGINAFYTNDDEEMSKALINNTTIVNTVPEMILDRSHLEHIAKNSYILDISSYPFGVDFKAATDLGIKNKSWLGIPSDVAPETAGKILAKKISSKIRGGE